MPTLNINNDLILFPSANVGIKATPSAWASGYSVLNVGDAAAISWTGAGANDFSFSTNAYYDTTDNRWEYRGTGDGSARYSMTALSYEHRWYNAPVGTANAAISYTQAMTLTGGGNLLINTTTDSGYKLNVNGDVYTSSNYGLNAVGDYAARYRTYAPADGNWGLLTYAADPEYHMVITGASSGDSGANRQFRIYDRPTSNTRFVVNFSNGYTGIGTAAPTRSLHVVGTTRHERVYAYANNVLAIPNSVSSGTVWVHLGTQGSFTTDKIYYRVGTNTSEEEGEIIVSNTCVEPLVEWNRNSYNIMVTAVKARMQGSCQPCEIWIQVRYGSNYGGANTTLQWQVHSGTDANFATINATGTPGTGTNEKNLTNTDGYFYETSGNIKAPRYSNAGFLGTGQNNARNHFTPLGAGSASPATGWIAAAFGDALADRIVIGQWTNGAQQAIFGAHTANLDDWADTNYVSKNHKFYYNGDWSITPALTINTSGNVLVGTTTDNGNKLRVQGTTWISGNVYTNGEQGVELSWTGNTINDNRIGRIRPISTSSQNPYAGGLAFDYYKYDGATYTFFEGMRLNGSGNVGIGTTSPFSKLQVGGNTFGGANGMYADNRVGISNHGNLTGLMLASTYNDATYPEYGLVFVQGPNTSSYNVWSISPDGPAKGSGLHFIYQANSTNIHNQTPAVSFIGSTGNVGIGTTAPTQKLEVVGSAAGDFPGIALTNTNTGGSSDAVTAIFRLTRSDGTTYSAPAIRFVKEQAWTTTASTIDAALAFSTTLNEGTTERMRITSDGNVGIGTAAPTARLTIGANTSVQSTNGIALGAGETSLEFVHSTFQNGFGSKLYSVDSGGGITSLRIATRPNSTSWSDAVTIIAGTSGNGNVGIGTTAPTAKLHIDSADDNAYALRVQGNTNNSVGVWTGIGIAGESANTKAAILFEDIGVSYSRGKMHFALNDSADQTSATPSNAVMTLIPSGNVGMGTTAPSYKLDVVGDSRITSGSLGVGVAPNATDGRIDASNDIVAFQTSDRRLKENITPIANALDKVKSLTGVEFDWKEETKHVHGYEGHDTGIIAQEVQAVMPTAVRTNDTGYLSVRYEKLIGLLVEANKELAARVEELEAKLK